MRKLSLLLVALVGCGGSDATIGDGGNETGTSADGGSDGGGNTDSGFDSGSSDGGTDTGIGMDSGGDSGTDGGGSGGRLFVSMESQAPAVWNNADSLSMDGSPSFTMSDSSVTSGTRGLAVASKRLFVGTSQSSGVLLAFDSADTFAANASPAAKVPSASFIAQMNITLQTDLLTWDSKSDTLWVSGAMSGTQLLTGATSLTSMSKAKALFTHAFQQVPGFAYDNAGDHALEGQISGAGLLAWNSASMASGSPAVSFTLDKTAADWSLAIEKDRLYGIGHYGNPEAIAVWKGISGITMAKAPDFTMGTMSGIATNDFSPFVTVQNDVLVACIQSGKVLLWTNASSLAGEKMPTQTITTGSLQNPRKAFIGPVTGRLYVLDDKGIAIYSNPTTSPSLVAKMTMGLNKPRDFVVLE